MRISAIMRTIIALTPIIDMCMGQPPGKITMPEADTHTLTDHTLGSAQELEGNIVTVSIFADDTNTSWDPENNSDDLELYYNMYDYVSVATDYITESGKAYGKDVNFIWDWSEHDDLVYSVCIEEDFTAAINDYTSDYYAWSFIDEYIDSDALLNKYNADSIVYLMFFDTPADNEEPSCTRNWYEGMEYPYEVCYLFTKDIYYDINPGVIAHEMLHTFGAPDLYGEDWQYGITEKFAEYGERVKLNDIMRFVGDVHTGEQFYDRIVNEITDITAYYIGWAGRPAVADRWKFGRSEHETTR